MPLLLVSSVHVVPPSVVATMGGSVPAGGNPPTATHVFASTHEIPNRPANGFGPPDPGTASPGVVTGVLCHVQVAPPSDVLTTCP